MEPLIGSLVRLGFYGCFVWAAVCTLIVKVLVPQSIVQTVQHAGSFFDMVAVELGMVPPHWKTSVLEYVANTGEVLTAAIRNILRWWSPKLAASACDELCQLQGRLYRAVLPSAYDSLLPFTPRRQVSPSLGIEVSSHGGWVDEASAGQEMLEGGRTAGTVSPGERRLAWDPHVDGLMRARSERAARPIARLSMDDEGGPPETSREGHLPIDWSEDESASGSMSTESEYEPGENEVEERRRWMALQGEIEEDEIREGLCGPSGEGVPEEDDGSVEEWGEGHRPKAVASLRDEDFEDSFEVALEPRATVPEGSVASGSASRAGQVAAGVDATAAHGLAENEEQGEGGGWVESPLEQEAGEEGEAALEERQQADDPWLDEQCESGHQMALSSLPPKARLSRPEDDEDDAFIDKNTEEEDEEEDYWRQDPAYPPGGGFRASHILSNPWSGVTEGTESSGESPLATATGMKVLTSPSPQRLASGNP